MRGKLNRVGEALWWGFPLFALVAFAITLLARRFSGEPMPQAPRLPASHSDYVFTVTGEEVRWSLVGPVLVALAVVVAYFFKRRSAGKE
jgi:hypothetical protein